jgi:hypothetical protein
MTEKRLERALERNPIRDMPKLQSPFVRKEIDENFIVTPEIDENYRWVFEDRDVRVIEKLHGSNVSIVIKNGYPDSIWNRTARIPFFNKGKRFIIDGVLESYDRGYCDLEDGQWFGELVGPKLNGNPYKLDCHLWIPFSTYCWDKLYYKSWGKYPKTYEAIREWFKDLMPLFYMRQHNGEKGFVEGVVFTHKDGRMAKLRIDMFDFYTGARHKDTGMEVKDGNE